MKKICLLAFAFLFHWSVFAQRDAQFYQSENKKYAFKLEGNSCTLYELDNYNTAVYYEYDLVAEREMEQPKDSMGILYRNNFFAVSYDYRQFSVVKLKKGKPKQSYRAQKLEDPRKLFEVINHSYWNKAYDRMLDELEYEFKLFGSYRYRDFNDSWEQVDFRQVYPEGFELQATQQIARIKDSITGINRELISLNETVTNNIHTLTPEALKENFRKRDLHAYAYSKYTHEFLSTVALMRPDLYLELTETFPEEKKFLYREAAFNREMHRAIRKDAAPGPVKKEYLKFKRREHLKAGLILTGVVIIDAAVITGLVLLIL